ncbi:MAG: hypothetical protein A2Y07_07925 [Planctomycetes bacterium GWF2_50_10]|nr:MAG: hypothetical protein A2Y07_07925 [Planctomycetes bacterium GWF2_50_10]
MFKSAFPAALLAIVFGFGLGSIPGLNSHLHWNLWYVIPISGVLFGIVVGGIQFGYCFLTNQFATKLLIVYLACATLLGYLAVDYGIYNSARINLSNVEGIDDGEHKLRDLISFWEYIKMNNGSSSVETRHGTNIMEIGALGSTISYIADLMGAALGTVGVVLVCKGKYPFCLPCQKYKKREQAFSIQFKYEQLLADQIFTGIRERIVHGSYTDLMQNLNELAIIHQDSKGDMIIDVDQRFCPMCYEATILGNVQHRKGKDWQEADDLKFAFTSQPGAHFEVPKPE